MRPSGPELAKKNFLYLNQMNMMVAAVLPMGTYLPSSSVYDDHAYPRELCMGSYSLSDTSL